MSSEPDAPLKRARNQYTKRTASEGAAEPANAGRNADGTFAKGNSANPSGKPKGTLHRATRAVPAMMEGEAEAITRKAIDLALAGDSVAMRLVMERLVSPVRERPVSFALPEIKSAADIVTATNAIAAAVASGELMPGEASAMSAIVANVGKAMELGELEARVALVEQHLGAPK